MLVEAERRLEARGSRLRPLHNLGRALLRSGLRRPESKLGKLVRQMNPFAPAFERAAAAIARGNVMLFGEIGREMARFLQTFPAPAELAPDRVAAFCEALPNGDPPAGQGYLRRAFRHYAEAALSTDPGIRAELMLLANAEIGFHEQTRLQPDIEAALDAPVEGVMALGGRLAGVLFVSAPRWPGVFGKPLALMCGLFGRLLARTARRIARAVITQRLMSMELAGDPIRLRDDVAPEYPEALRSIEHPELRELIARLEQPGQRSGVDDWADFADRMHYILMLFRTRQEDPKLFDPPFHAADIAAFQAGRLPAGRF